MKFRRTRTTHSTGSRSHAAFTLAETLAALAFVAIVIPVGVHAVQVANLAGQVAERKLVAAQVADRMLNELIVTGRWNSSASGSVTEGRHTFNWKSQTASFERATLRQVDVTVTYTVQGRDYIVRSATVMDSAQQ